MLETQEPTAPQQYIEFHRNKHESVNYIQLRGFLWRMLWYFGFQKEEKVLDQLWGSHFPTKYPVPCNYPTPNLIQT